jgi:hypothetical protein
LPRIRLHDRRHAHASILLKAGEVLGLEVDVLLQVTDLGLADSAVSRPQAANLPHRLVPTGGVVETRGKPANRTGAMGSEQGALWSAFYFGLLPKTSTDRPISDGRAGQL